jgi:5-methylthioadenosine/S-adenosylhomocysteine deaminase
MGQELRAALFVRHLAAKDPSAGFCETLSTLLQNNATIANRYFHPGVGVLEPGYAADVIALDYAPPTPFDAGTFLGHYAFGLACAPVDTTICDGRVLMEGKRLLLDVDEAEVAAKARECATSLWERF